MNSIEALGNSRLFRNIPDAERGKLAELAREENLGPGESLCREGHPGNVLYVLVMGTVKVTQKDEVITTLGTGSYFGEIELFRSDHESTASVTTVEPSTVMAFDREKLLEACDADHELGFYVYKALAAGLVGRLAKTTRDATHYKSMVVKHK